MFTVAWSEKALDQLADIFVGSDLTAQDRMTAAVSALNQRLTRRPHDEGESRSGQARLVFIDMLAVGFWIDENASTVRVDAVRRYGR